MPQSLRPAAVLLFVTLAGVGPAATQVPAYEQSFVASARLAQLAIRPAQPSVVTAVTWTTDDLTAQRRRRVRRDPGTVFLIVGGAVAVAGIVTDEGLLVVGGVVLAGYGLYLNLR